MKKIFLLLFICSFLKASANREGKCFPMASSFTDTTIIQNILSLPLGTYIGKPVDSLLNILSTINLSYYHSKPVDSLLNHLPAGIIDMKIMGWHNLRRADVLYVSYSNNVFIAIHVNKFSFMNPNGAGDNPPNLNWDINLFKKENVSYIVAFNGTQCINGCQYKYK